MCFYIRHRIGEIRKGRLLHLDLHVHGSTRAQSPDSQFNIVRPMRVRRYRTGRSRALPDWSWAITNADRASVHLRDISHPAPLPLFPFGAQRARGGPPRARARRATITTQRAAILDADRRAHALAAAPAAERRPGLREEI